jgi:1-acyl-sn-glycerol-3-phosphate acyltransferase
MTRTYAVAMAACRSLAAWGRISVEGVEALPPEGPSLVAGNHDSYFDPLMIGFAARERRQIRALAKAELWKVPGLSKVLDGMGQIPIDRGAGDAKALDTAIAELRAGACIGVFPEGTRSRGEELRARSGIARLALAVPEAKLVLCSVEGTTDFIRFPKRPRIRLRFFEPAEGQTQDGEEAAALAARLLGEIRAGVPPAAIGRRPKTPAGA